MPGREGVTTSIVPIFEASGQAMGSLVPLANCASVQTSSPLATEGLMPAPSGNVTSAVRSCELVSPSGSGLKGMKSSTVAGSGESVLLSTVVLIFGSNGTTPQLVAL